MRSAFAYCAGPAALASLPLPSVATRLPPALVWLILARRALEASDAKDALRCFDAALTHEPGLALAHLGRAFCLARLDRDDESARALAAATRRAAGQGEALYALAKACAQHGEISLALPFLARAIEALPVLEERALRDPLFADHPAVLAALGRL